MAVLYVKDQGACIRKTGERITVAKGTLVLSSIPAFQIEGIAVIGNIQITSQAMRFLMESGIDVGYFTCSGKYLGKITGESNKNIFLRFEQYQCYLDEKRRLSIARTITSNKIDNQIAMITGYRWKDKEYDYKSIVAKIEKYRLKLPEMTTSTEIMGVEGICSKLYFDAFGHMLKSEFAFNGRNRRPPKDPVNVLLSLGYSFLTREICSILDAESFESYLGFLHGIRYGRKSLALDIIEEFRQPVVDRLVLFLLNKKMMSADDFEITDEPRVTLNDHGFRIFLREFERWMDGRNPLSGNASFRKQIIKQAGLLRAAISERKDYIPYSWKNRKELDDGNEDVVPAEELNERIHTDVSDDEEDVSIGEGDDHVSGQL